MKKVSTLSLGNEWHRKPLSFVCLEEEILEATK